MSALLWSIALWVVGYSVNLLPGANTETTCEWVKSEATNIPGGALQISARDVLQCQEICIKNPYCKSVDWDKDNRCYLLNTTEGKKPTTGVTHYDYVCKKNPCTPNPCQNAGLCVQGATENDYSCTCSNGWSGFNCETPPDPCINSPCKNGGECSAGSRFNEFTCVCINGFSGQTCEIAPPDPCSSSPCKNGGQCSVGSSFNVFVCDCINGFTGSTCDTAPPGPCSRSPCKNGGECSTGSSFNVFVCDCINGFSGSTCETAPPDPCRNSPCKNGGQCFGGSDFNEFVCDCENGYSGPTCEIPPPEPVEPTEAPDPEYPDCRAKEMVRNAKSAQCLHSNYPGRISDLYNKRTQGFSWQYRLPRFQFNWPADIRGRRITKLFFASQTNLDYYRAVILHGNNQRFESKSVRGELVLQGITSIHWVQVFFAPLDMEEELTVTGFQIRHCPLKGQCQPRDIFDRVRNVDVANQGPIRNHPRINDGRLSWKTSMILPYVDVDVKCYGYNDPEIFRIGIEAINNGFRTNVKIWNNGRRVPITNIHGQITEYFNFRPASPTNVNAMRFKRRTVYGDRIRVTFIPPKDRVQGIEVYIWWRSFFVKICY